MARGDRESFKADTDDGYTKIANLLLEALAMAKMNGVQKGICLFLWRRTYGWGIKEDQITLKEFALACDTSEPYISRQLKVLESWKVIVRTSAPQGKASTFTFNTRVAEWDRGCINVQGLSECAVQGLYICAIQGLHDCARVDEGQALEPLEIKAPLKKDKRNIYDIDDDQGLAKIQIALQEAGILMPSSFEVQKLLYWVTEGMSFEVVLFAIEKAALANARRVDYIDSTLRNLFNAGVRTLEEAKAENQRFEQRKARDGPKLVKPKAREPEEDKKRAALLDQLYVR